jgi:hypothetical protein
MKYLKIFILLSVSINSCKKKDSSISLDEKLVGRWNLISESLIDGAGFPLYRGTASAFIEFKVDGKAYSNIPGQVGLIYPYQLNSSNETMMFNYVQTSVSFLANIPCADPSGGCLRQAKIKYLSNNLLVLGNTFVDPNNANSSATYLDSLSR